MLWWDGNERTPSAKCFVPAFVEYLSADLQERVGTASRPLHLLLAERPLFRIHNIRRVEKLSGKKSQKIKGNRGVDHRA